MRVGLFLSLAGFISLALGGVASQYLQHRDPVPTAAKHGQSTLIEDFAFIDQHGIKHSSRNWRGKVMVINFWATWCPPCIHEIPLLNSLQARYGEANVQIVGIAISKAQQVRAFLAKHPMAYPTLIPAEPLHSIARMRRAGNVAGGLPYTLFVDRKGYIVHRHLGELDRQQAIEWLDAALAL